jgi:hypothetical protein
MKVSDAPYLDPIQQAKQNARDVSRPLQASSGRERRHRRRLGRWEPRFHGLLEHGQAATDRGGVIDRLRPGDPRSAARPRERLLGHPVRPANRRRRTAPGRPGPAAGGPPPPGEPTPPSSSRRPSAPPPSAQRRPSWPRPSPPPPSAPRGRDAERPAAPGVHAPLESPHAAVRASTRERSRARVREGVRRPRRPARKADAALRRVFAFARPWRGEASATPARRALLRPIAIACFVDRAPCLPSRT